MAVINTHTVRVIATISHVTGRLIECRWFCASCDITGRASATLAQAYAGGTQHMGEALEAEKDVAENWPGGLF